jgi:hypothetical protein
VQIGNAPSHLDTRLDAAAGASADAERSALVDQLVHLGLARDQAQQMVIIPPRPTR